MIDRLLDTELRRRIDEVPAVILLGPRQVGKTTLAHAVAAGRPSTYLDLETAGDRDRLADPAWYLEAREHELVILDEVHRMPELFQELRGLIDRGRRHGLRSGRFLLLGSAALDLLRQSESLAGRVSYLELGPVGAAEVDLSQIEELWVRGGFPDSLLASSDKLSIRWRRDLVRAYLERDAPMFRPRSSPELLRRLWTMLAHSQGGLLNAAQLAASLSVSANTVTAYVDLLADLMLVRRLPPWSGNVRKRLVRAPKVYVRDSGLVHALLGLGSLDEVLGHPVAGMSWEGLAIESILAVAPDGTNASFYRTSHGAEVDLVLELPGQTSWAIEIKHGTRATLSRGFHHACADLAPERAFVVTSGDSHERLSLTIESVGLRRFVTEVMRDV